MVSDTLKKAGNFASLDDVDLPVLQIRGGIVENLKIIFFLFFSVKTNAVSCFILVSDFINAVSTLIHGKA